MTYAPGTSKRLLDLVSSAVHEIVTRKKLSANIKQSASLVSEALQALLADDLDNLSSVLELLDEAATSLNRPSSSLNEARDLINGTPASATTPSNAAPSSKKKAFGQKASGKKASGKKTSGKKTSARKTAVRKTSGKPSATGKRVAKKTAARS